MAISLDLSGRVILLCGAARGGIGGATARVLAAAGASLVLVDRAQEILDETLADVAKTGVPVHAIVTDLMNSDETDSIIAAVFEKFGRLDGLANVAGGTRADEWRPLEDTGTELYRASLNLNLEYVFRICRDAAAELIKRDEPASFVNVTSISGLTSAPYHGPYGAAKAGMAALTRTMAFEWARYGIRANSIAPGAVPTDRVMSRIPGDAPVDTSSDIVMTTVDELANAIVFLLSDLASGISGQNIAVDSALSTKFAGGPRRLDAVKATPRS